MHKNDDNYYNSSIPRLEFTDWVKLDHVEANEVFVGDVMVGTS